MRVPVVVAFLCLTTWSLAGCADSPTTDSRGEVAVDPLLQTRSLRWAGNDQGDTAYEITIEVGSANECRFDASAATRPSGYGPAGLMLVHEDYGGTVTWNDDYPMAAVHAGPIDTRSGKGAGGLDGTVEGSFEGVVVLTLVLPGLHSAGATSATVDIQCAEPFDLLQSWKGHSLMLTDVDGLGGGAGASFSSAASLNLGDSQSVEIAGVRARLGVHYIGEQAGQLTLDHPEGTRSWAMPGYAFEFLEGKPGRYTLTMDRAAVRFDNFWFTVFGLATEFDLTPGLRVD